MAEDAEVRQHLHQVVMLRPFPYFPSHKERFSKQFQPLNVFESSEPAHLFLSTHAQSARVLLCAGFTPVTSDMLRCLPSLQCIITTSAGVEHIDLGECRRRGIAVANAGNAFSVDVADYAVGLLLDVLRRISAADSYVRRGLWPVQGDFRLGHKCIVGTSAGVDHIDLAECRRRGISVTNAGTAFSEDVADLAVGFFLDLLRRVSSTDRYVRRGLWPLNGDYPLGFKVASLPYIQLVRFTRFGIPLDGRFVSSDFLPTLAFLFSSFLVVFSGDRAANGTHLSKIESNPVKRSKFDLFIFGSNVDPPLSE
ncbi:PREDICTED: glyoxylate/hydroxypyruvate reductase HPR3 isoform X3 [Nelumbo nucifera]|uniref:Glyoxylate/hydroxypyruvate reductase HPR3 isoform X3 n=1 Tax=Nelumbo nucifera TaxID=4432 RepID=A0A1U8QAP6_NELNU|nr:PREDICTED: glyoxylate/hydroxypyruvate reductase HPR3 isoform X3 [Nelumbo nucifera]